VVNRPEGPCRAAANPGDEPKGVPNWGSRTGDDVASQRPWHEGLSVVCFRPGAPGSLVGTSKCREACNGSSRVAQRRAALRGRSGAPGEPRAPEEELNAPALGFVFIAGTAVALATSWLLVTRIERVGARLRASEALLGLIAALAADTPEITAAVTALTHHQQKVGAGVVIGSNVFNLAALLGLGAVVSGGIALHRRVVVLTGGIAVWVALASVIVSIHLVPPAVGLGLVLAVVLPYAVIAGLGAKRVLAPCARSSGFRSWLSRAVADEESDLIGASHPRRGSMGDGVVAVLALVVVVAGSVAVERAASSLGVRFGVPDIVTGGLVLAAITSLPNAVAAVYLARRGRGSATLSTAFNSNALNVAVGLLLPATVLGLGRRSDIQVLVAVWYLVLTGVVVLFAYRDGRLGRATGWLVMSSYAAFAAVVLTAGLRGTLDRYTILGPGIALAAVSAILLIRPGRISPVGGAPLSFGADRQSSAPWSGIGTSSNGSRRPGRQTLLRGWSVDRLSVLAVVLSGTVAASDALLGHRVVLIGALVVGPCTAVLTARWSRTAILSGWALAVGLLLGVPDRIWARPEHFAFLGAVGIVGIVLTGVTAIVERGVRVA
jgi:cation:H+ antiporter